MKNNIVEKVNIEFGIDKEISKEHGCVGNEGVDYSKLKLLTEEKAEKNAQIINSQFRDVFDKINFGNGEEKQVGW